MWVLGRHLSSQKFIWPATQPTGKSSIPRRPGQQKQLAGPTRPSLIQLSLSCHRAATGRPKGWVTGWTADMPRRTDRGKARASPSAAGESLLIICGRGLLGHPHSRGLVVGAWLWGIQTEAAGVAWWYEHWYVSQGVICCKVTEPTCPTRLEGVHVTLEMQHCFRNASNIASSGHHWHDLGVCSLWGSHVCCRWCNLLTRSSQISACTLSD